MMYITASLIGILLVFLNHAVAADDSVVDEMTSIAKLRKKLLANYQISARPVKNHKTQTNVSFSMLVRVVDVDIKTMTMTTANYMVLSWYDEHLTWNPEDYEGIDKLLMYSYEIWTPDIRSYDFTHRWDNGIDQLTMTVFKDGFVSWWPTSVFRSHCDIDLSNFPFDTQVCTLYLLMYVHDSTGVKLKGSSYWGSGPPIVGPYEENSIWELVSISDVIENNNETQKFIYDYMEATFTLKRRNQSYFYPIILPYLSGLAFGIISFLEPVASKRRVILALTSIAISLTILFRLVSELGSHSLTIPFGIKCCAISIITVTVGTFLPIILLLIYRLNVFLLPKQLVHFLRNPWASRIFFLQSNDDNSEGLLNNPESPDETEEQMTENQRQEKRREKVYQEWRDFITFVDSLSFFIFLVLITIYHA